MKVQEILQGPFSGLEAGFHLIYCLRRREAHHRVLTVLKVIIRNHEGTDVPKQARITQNIWEGKEEGLCSLLLRCPLSSSVQRSSRWAHCEPDWWTGMTASCGGGTRGPPWWDLPGRWLRSSPGHPSPRGFWPGGGWCRSHTWSSAQNGQGRREKNGCSILDALLRNFKAQCVHLRIIWCCKCKQKQMNAVQFLLG